MRTTLFTLFLAVVIGACTAAWADDGLQAPDPAGKWEQTDLKFKVLPRTELAASKPIPVGIKIELPSPSGGFAVLAEGGNVMLDVTGDGNVNTKVKEGQPVIMNVKYDDGDSVKYAVRFYRGTRMEWYYETATSMQGTVKGEKITLIDANVNGKFDEVGKDALIVGKGRYGIPLSRVVSIKGTLYHFKVDPKGSSVSVQEYTGPVGTLDMRKNFKCPGALEYAIVQNQEAYFDMNEKGGFKVPAGKYTFLSGRLVKGKKSCDIVKGTWKETTVEADKTTEPEWGPPMKIVFKAKLNEEKYHIDAAFHVLGLGGEEYVNFSNVIMTPEISAKSKEGIEADKGKFATG